MYTAVVLLWLMLVSFATNKKLNSSGKRVILYCSVVKSDFDQLKQISYLWCWHYHFRSWKCNWILFKFDTGWYKRNLVNILNSRCSPMVYFQCKNGKFICWSPWWLQILPLVSSGWMLFNVRICHAEEIWLEIRNPKWLPGVFTWS
jgi:hypothetical protein